MILRPYQQAAVDSLFSYFENNNGNPLLVLPTAAGKSIVQAAFITETLRRWPGERFLLLSHVKELLSQNAAKLNMDVGIYSAGLGRKDIRQVTVAGIQSIYKRAHEAGDVSIVIIDEAHLVSKHDNAMYRRFLSDLLKFCPHVKIIGMSATPFRLDSGPLVAGKDRIFTDICYQVSMLDLMGQGFLAGLRTAPTHKRVDTSGVKKRGGEYVVGELEKAMDKNDITGTALDEVEVLCAERQSWLVFCVGVDHAAHVADAIRARGHACEVVVGTTPAGDRARHLEAFKARRIRALVSVGVLTTGFDAPCADALVCLRPTESPGLWVQMVGRVTRPFPGKVDGLVVDFTSNTKNHGPVDQITIDEDGNVKAPGCRVCVYCQGLVIPPAKVCSDCGKAAGKTCPACGCPMEIDQVQCPGCGLETIRQPRKPRHETKASDAPILSTALMLPETKAVKSWDFARHKKEGKPDSVRVRYWCGLEHFDEWLCFDHGGYAADKARRWWKWGAAPRSTDEALARTNECKPPASILVRRDGKYWRVM